MRSFWGAAGDWLERSSSRIGAISSLIGVAGSVATAAVATHAAINEHRYAVISFLAVAVTLFLFAWPRLRRRLWRTSTQARLVLVEQQDRARLIDAIYAWRVQQGLEASLKRAVRLQVGLEQDPRLVQAQFRTDSTAAGVEMSVQEAFERAQGRLLIAGEAGSGKTTLALELLSHLLDRARADATAGVPELFPLASWARRPGPLLSWLEHELRQRGFGPRWIREGRLIPILDGLDEVDEDQRANCLEVINDFRDFYEGRPLVVTCRIAEYSYLLTKHPALAFGAGYVTQPLPTAQILQYVAATARHNSAWGEVRDAIARGDADELCQLWRTPLMLSVAVLAYAHGDPRELLAARSPTDRVWEVFMGAVRTRSLDPRHPQPTNPDATAVRGVKLPYTLEEIRRWLGWLASSPGQRGEIWLHQLEPPPVRHGSARRAQAMTSGLACGLFLGLSLSLVSGAFETERHGPAYWIGDGLVFGSVFGLLLGTAGALFSNATHITGRPSAKHRVVVGVAYTFAIWLAFSLAYALSETLVYRRGVPMADELLFWSNEALVIGLAFGITGGLRGEPSYLSGWSVNRFKRSLRGGLLIGSVILGLPLGVHIGLMHYTFMESNLPLRIILYTLAGMLLGGLFGGLVGGLVGGLSQIGPPLEQPVSRRPTHWLVESAKSAAVLGVLLGPVFGLLIPVFGLLIDIRDTTTIVQLVTESAALGVAFGLAAGLDAVCWHALLRLRCWRRGLLPLRLVTFLDWAADHLYLQHAGGAYQWAHPTLVNYLERTSIDHKTSPREPDAEVAATGNKSG